MSKKELKTELVIRAIKLNTLKTLLDYMGKDNHHLIIKVETPYHTDTFTFQNDRELASRVSATLASEAYNTDRMIEDIEFPLETADNLFDNMTAREAMEISQQVTNVSGDDTAEVNNG